MYILSELAFIYFLFTEDNTIKSGQLDTFNLITVNSLLFLKIFLS